MCRCSDRPPFSGRRHARRSRRTAPTAPRPPARRRRRARRLRRERQLGRRCRRRAPRDDAEYKVTVAGDSISVGLGASLRGAVDTDTVVKVIGVEGTGLARPDNFDWPNRLAELARDFPPQVLVLSLGSNDAQDLVDASGKPVAPLSTRGVGGRVRRPPGRELRRVRGTGTEVIWVGHVRTQEDRVGTVNRQVHEIATEVAADRDWVQVEDLAAYLGSGEGIATTCLIEDGLHLTVACLDRAAAGARRRPAVPQQLTGAAGSDRARRWADLDDPPMTTTENRTLVERSGRPSTTATGTASHVLRPDSEYTDVPTPADDIAVGPEQIVARLRLGIEPISAYEHELILMVADGDAVVTEHTETWHWKTGEVVTLPFVSVHVVRDGTIDRWWDYWDLQTLLGAAPPGGSSTSWSAGRTRGQLGDAARSAVAHPPDGEADAAPRPTPTTTIMMIVDLGSLPSSSCGSRARTRSSRLRAKGTSWASSRGPAR